MKHKNSYFVGRKPLEYYNNLLIKADLGLHDQIADLIQTELSDGASILDCGAGEGALCARLADIGYCVTGVDKDVEHFKCKNVAFSCINFDSPEEVDAFVDVHTNLFDAVIGVEVIEHVQDQWKYARELMNMAKPGGLVLISTPNTTSWLSRAIFFLTGQFHQFGDSDLEYGHISPVTPWELSLIFKAAGAEEVSVTAAGTLPPIYFTGFNKLSLLSLLMLPLRIFMRGTIDGWCIIATARKKK
jgi:SAM-dependent methyltransferase